MFNNTFANPMESDHNRSSQFNPKWETPALVERSARRTLTVLLLVFMFLCGRWTIVNAQEQAVTPQEELTSLDRREITPNDFRISDVGSGASGDALVPAVAYNAVEDEYLVVWQGDDTGVTNIVDNESEIFGQRIHATTGQEIAPNDFRISDVGPVRDPVFGARSAAVVHNPDRNEYLIVWSGDENNGDYEIYGQLLASDGTEIGLNDFQISATGFTTSTRFVARSPAVAYDPFLQQYLVVWSANGLVDEEGEFIAESEIVGIFLDAATGEKLRTRPVRISHAGSPGDTRVGTRQPAVVYNPDQHEYLVSWSVKPFDLGAPATMRNVFAQRLSPTGLLLFEEDLQVSRIEDRLDGTLYAEASGVAYNASQQEYLIVWANSLDDASAGISGQRLDIDGSKLGVPGFAISPPADAGADPKIAYLPATRQFVVTWRSTIVAATVETYEISGTLLDPEIPDTATIDAFPLSDMGPENVPDFYAFTPAIDCQSLLSRCLVVWAGNDNVGDLAVEEIEIFGQLVSDGFALTALTDAYATAQSRSLAVPAPGILGNDSDPAGQVLAAQLTKAPQKGTLTLNADGSFVYAPHVGAVGFDQFEYRATVGSGGTSKSAEVNIEVTDGSLQNRLAPLVYWADEFSDPHGWGAHDSHWGTIQFPDVTGDGRADVCGRSTAGIFCGVAKQDGTGLETPTHWESDFSNANGWRSDPTAYLTIQYPDLNNDDKADVCGRNATGIVCGLSDGASFSPYTQWATEFGSQGWDKHASHWATLRFPDLNGDGRADVCARSTAGIFCGLAKADATGFAQPTHWEGAFSNDNGWRDDPSNWATIQFPDINGDGKADLCGRADDGIHCGVSTGTQFVAPTLYSDFFSDAKGWAADPSYWGTIRFPDVNGDGMDDVCGRTVTGIYCALANQDAFDPATPWRGSNFTNAFGWQRHPSFWQTIQYPDLDRDGKADVCGRFVNGMICARSSGSEFEPVSKWQVDFADGRGWAVNASHYQKVLFVDVTGDGYADLCGRHAEGIFCARNEIEGLQPGAIGGLAITPSSSSITLGEAVQFSASVAAGSDVNYAWDFGDGTTGTGAIVNPVYTQPGEYTVSVTASNNLNQETATAAVQVTQSDGEVNYLYLPLLQK